MKTKILLLIFLLVPILSYAGEIYGTSLLKAWIE